MEQKVIGCGGISVSSSCLLFAPAQQVPGHMATACGVPVPVSIAVMKLLLGVFTVCAHQHFRSPAQPSKAPAMSSKEQKDMERRAKRPRVDQNLPSDDFQNPDAITPANNPAVDTSEMGSCSSGPDVQEAREPVQKRIPDVKGDVTRYLLAKRKQFEKDINASLSSLNESLQSVFKTQQKSRQELHSMHSQMFESLYHKWLDEVGRAREQEEHLTKAKDLSEHLKAFIGGEESEVKKEISKAQDRVIMETQEQDVSVVETYLQSLVLDHSEETI
ncbi:X-linked lymphocyte-regulated protein 5C-like isoform X5 [Peromyscus californicus insignis]|uniref:X-linked lymphocyte-regulated protein 5C-like isoform X4 n=1 Tax=Peromyscus californicus insignis TaxID=564181 RepID=UPI0022A67779|nr:X-linked lymphocyte-regulated protein 5C-like isoform X4 [Peromyscus californicus insignis]XP_052597362.1 X-linked lymphocyte-regulated protein 5C-like isoform X5 [Peromyscus californicus insignis]XP_052597395.1 X-linked lymphocyte-regulated protein 5C-like isoform X5 [Peromyscus californicus insignis]